MASAEAPTLLRNIFDYGSKAFLMFGGVIPYIPQYLEISRTNDAEGFSLLVCFILLIANTTRIFFWFGKRYETILLIQSIIICITMFAMIELCVRVKHRPNLYPNKNRYFFEKFDPDSRVLSDSKTERKRAHRFWDFDIRYFWKWTDFISYVEFMVTYSVMLGLLTYAYLDNNLYVEGLGYAALLIEACLALPQLIKNHTHKSTKGLSKNMVLLWALGDVYKTTYYIINDSGNQFLVCGITQIIIDLLIGIQILIYAPSVKYAAVNLKKAIL